MHRLVLITAALFALTISCSSTKEKSGKDNVKYKNSYLVIGKIDEPGIWSAGEELTVVDPENGNTVGRARIDEGEGTHNASFKLETDLESGASVIVKRKASVAAKQKQKSAGAKAFDAYSPGVSGPIVLDPDWPANFILSQDYCIIGITPQGPVQGPSPKISSVCLSCEEAADISDEGKSVTVTLSTPMVLSDELQTIWMTVRPVDLNEKSCSLKILGEDYSFTGRSLQKGESYNLRFVFPEGAMTHPATSGAEFTTTTVQYKPSAETASYSTATALPLDGMNRMSRYNVDPTDRWGGYKDVKPDSYVSNNTAGFWRTGKYKGRWVMVNPDGNVTIIHGINGVAPNYMKEAASDRAQEEYEKRFPSISKWADWAGLFLADYGFNFFSTGPKRIRLYRQNYSLDTQQRLRSSAPDKTMGQVEILYLLRTFLWDYNSLTGKSLNTDKGSVFTLLFDPAYLDYIDALAKDGTDLFKDDKAFIGYYIDNELQFRYGDANTPAIYLKQWLSLDTSSSSPRAFAYAKQYAENFIRDKYGVEPVAANVTTAMDNAFLTDICEYYYRTTTEAIRKYDPNHLILGSRLHGKPKSLSQVHAACAKYCDVVSVNVYGVWEPNDSYFISQFKPWVSNSKPCFVTEFYTRDALARFDGAAYGNTGEGGGWIVKGQESRGLYYQNFVRKLISYDHCIGWQWFQMTDDYSETYGWNNKGVVDPTYEPYYELTDRMRALNWNIYQIMEYYHSTAGAPSVPSDDLQLVYWE